MSGQWLFLECMSVKESYSSWVIYSFIVLYKFFCTEHVTLANMGVYKMKCTVICCLHCCVLRNSMPIGYKVSLLGVRGLECWLATPVAVPHPGYLWDGQPFLRDLSLPCASVIFPGWSGSVLQWKHQKWNPLCWADPALPQSSGAQSPRPWAPIPAPARVEAPSLAWLDRLSRGSTCRRWLWLFLLLLDWLSSIANVWFLS